MKWRHRFALAAILALYFVLRLPWVGHLLTWDEAMNLLSVRALAAQGGDLYSSYIWHHPPLLPLLLLAVQPLRAGFAERAEVVAIFIGAVNVLALFFLVKRTSREGVVGVALWAAFFLAVMPGAMFYDTWIKRDVLAAVFGLVALLLFIERWDMLSGAALGLAFLSKETAAFYAIAIFLLWLARRSNRRVVDLAVCAGTTVLVAGWWYVAFSGSVHYFVAFVGDLKTIQTGVQIWTRPWHYYLLKLMVNLGVLGVILCLVGVTAQAATWAKRGGSGQYLWPLFLAVPGYVILSVAKAKAPWFTTALFPALAALQGIGAYAALQGMMNLRRAFVPVAAIGLALAVFFVAQAWGRDYEQSMREQDEPIWWGCTASRQAAVELRSCMTEGQKALITPMHYWDARDVDPCPIFVYYLGDLPVLVRPYGLTADELVDAVKTYRLDWAMVSPMPGDGEKKLIEPLAKKYKIEPAVLKGAFILKTDSIYRGKRRR